MSNRLEYILDLGGNLSNELRTITIESNKQLEVWSKVQTQVNAANTTMSALGVTAGSLRQRLGALQSQQEWIPSNNIAALRSSTLEISRVESQLLRLQTTGSKGVGDDLSKSLAQLKSRLSEYKTASENTFRSDHIRKYNALIDATEKQIKTLTAQTDTCSKKTNEFSDALSLVNISAFLSASERISRTLSSIGQSGISFDKSLHELQAITGITGSALDGLADNSRRIGVETGLGAGAAVGAYKTLASQIDIDRIGIEGLNELQQKTITLAQSAPELGITGAANALSATMNQFSLEATEADRVINVLAAGSKVAAAEIPDLAESFKVVGSTAAAAGVSVEQTTGLLEVLSGGAIKGAEAGTALRNVLLGLQLRGGINFSVTKPAEALSALKERVNDTTLMFQLFGKENMAAAQYLIQNAALIDDFTTRVTGTTTATEQAAIMTDTWETKMARINARMDGFKMTLFDATGGTISYLGAVGEAAGGIANFVPLIWGMSKAMKAMNLSFLASPLGLWIGGIAAATAGVYALTKAWQSHNDVTNAATTSNALLAAEINTEQQALWSLFDSLKATEPESAERNRLIGEINDKYPDLLTGLNMEKAGLDEIAKAQAGANNELAKNIFLKGLNEKEAKGVADIQAAEQAAFAKLTEQGYSAADINWALTRVQNLANENDYTQDIDRDIAISRAFGQTQFWKREAKGWGPWAMPGIAGSEELIELLRVRDNNQQEADLMKAFATGRLGIDLTPAPVAPISPSEEGEPTPAENQKTLKELFNKTKRLDIDGDGIIDNKKQNGGGKSATLNLNDLSSAQDYSESSDYAAITGRMKGIQLPGLGKAAASVAAATMLATAPMGDLPQVTPASTPTTEAAVRTRDNTRPMIHIEHFGENLTIHIANADGKGYDQIREEVERALFEMVDDYAEPV